ncbi:MAG: GNAT family N-acetyltransferase [Nanohaloarchaea archaeon QH_8_44_6]|nr:MAG: GNAT family N-acetyltransferase [Nanohaloarchaea archaeon QH_8_44_6]
MELKEADKQELETLVELWFSLAKGMEKYSDLNRLIYESENEVDKEEFLNQLEDENYTFYLIREKEETIGYTKLEQGRNPSREFSDHTRIVEIFIKKDYRNKGFGSKTIEEVKQIASNEGSDHLKISSEWDNRGARRLYKREGFEEKQVSFVHKLD